jgi:hypothetical protein
MRTTNRWKFLALLALMAGPGTLAGCGRSGPQEAQSSVARGVFTNASDCAAIGMLTLDKCSKAIEQAIAQHESAAPTYPSLKACEKAEGAEKCERTDTKSFRPQLMAFLFTLSDPPLAEPLYPTGNGERGFRTAKKSVLLSEDESLTFSRQALAAAEMHAGPGGGAGYNF